MRETDGKIIEQARGDGPFLSIEDFARRTGLGQAVVKRLAEADAFGSLGAGRRQALWQALAQEKKRRALPLFDGVARPEPTAMGVVSNFEVNHALRSELRDVPPSVFKNTSGQAYIGIDEPPAILPAMPSYEEVVADYRTAGLSLRAHPISFYRDQLDNLGITPAEGLLKLKNDAPVRVAGIVLLRQRPGTAKGITFVTLEDETGTINLVLHQHMWDRYYRIARRAPAWIVHGQLQSTEDETPVIHVVVDRLESLSEQLRQLDVKSRDFR